MAGRGVGGLHADRDGEREREEGYQDTRQG